MNNSILDSNIFENFFSNIKLVEKAIMGYQGSYVELLTILAIALLAVISSIAPIKYRQLFRFFNQIAGIFIFVFVVFTCLGVFGMIRNFHRGLNEIGRENIVALYYMSVPLTVLVSTMLFGGTFCGWICPTGTIQEFVSFLTKKFHLKRKKSNLHSSLLFLIGTIIAAIIFLIWIWYLSQTRIFFIEDSCIYWSQAIIIILFFLAISQKKFDLKLRKLRVISFWIVVMASLASIRITSPVHLGFAKVYDPASFNATIMVIIASLLVPRFWCKYLCPWRLAICWAADKAPRKIIFEKDKCNSCNKCTDTCDMDAIQKGYIRNSDCIMCMKCIDNCPTNALKLKDDFCKKC